MAKMRPKATSGRDNSTLPVVVIIIIIIRSNVVINRLLTDSW